LTGFHDLPRLTTALLTEALTTANAGYRSPAHLFHGLFFLETTPGPDMMLVLARGIGQGRRTALLTVVGMIFIAGLVQVGLLVLGVASLLQAHPSGLVVLRWIGAVYLLYLGARMIRSSVSGQKNLVAPGCFSPRHALREGTINSLTNPKSLLFMFAFLPQFVDPASGPSGCSCLCSDRFRSWWASCLWGQSPLHPARSDNGCTDGRVCSPGRRDSPAWSWWGSTFDCW